MKIYVLIYAYLTIQQCFLFIVTSSAVCNYTIFATDQIINLSSPGYPLSYGNNVNCWWRIQATSNDKLVGVKVFSFGLQTSRDCVYDSLSFFDGRDINSPLLDKRCGNRREPVVSTGPDMYLNFITDRSNAFRELGFQLQIFQVQKCGGDLTATYEPRFLTSPGYPYTYFNNISCTWRIKGKYQSDTIMVKANVVQLIRSSLGSTCFRDYLTFYNGHVIGQQDTGLLGRFCGTPYPTVLSAKNEIMIHFHTDSNLTGPGFNLSYTARQGGECNYTMVASPYPTMIYSPGYPDAYYNNLDCYVQISSITNIRLHIIRLDIEGPSPHCAKDSLTVYRGYYKNELLATLCGDAVNGRVIHSNSTSMSLWFTTDSNIVGRGYRIEVTSVYSPRQVVTVRPSCGNRYLTATSSPQYLQSPGYPIQYVNNQDCTWTITTSNTNMNVRIIIVDADFGIADRGICRFDYVSVYDGQMIWGTLLHKWCSMSPTFIQSSGNKVTVLFHSSSFLFGQKGFKLKYYETDEPVCGGRINASRTVQFLKSPNYPGNYGSNLDCIWRVYAPRDMNIQLTMSHFEIESSSSCAYGSVRIYDGTGNEPTGVGKLCGSSPTSYTSSENSMTIIFTSDSATQKSGFDFRIETGNFQACFYKPYTLSATTYEDHYLRSPNYPFSYPNNADCTWLIDTEDDDYVVQINILEMNIEISDGCLKDYVEAFDGEDDSASSLLRRCGFDDVTIKSSTGRYMFLKFKSDSSGLQGRFKIQYTHEFQPYHPDVNTGSIVGGIIGSIAAIVIIIIIVGCISSRTRKPAVTRARVTSPPQDYMYTVSQGTLEATVTPAAFAPPPSYSEVTTGKYAPEDPPPPYPGVTPSSVDL